MTENNNNNNYSDFNSYSQPQPAQPIYIQPQPDMNSAQDAKTAKNLGIWGIGLSVASCCCCCGLPLPSVVGLILSIIGLKKNKGNSLCIVGIILNGLILLYGIYSLAITDWAAMSEMTSEIMNMYGQALSDPEAFMENYDQYMQSFSQY